MSNREFQDEATSWPLVVELCRPLVCFREMFGRTAQIAASGATTQEVETWLTGTRANSARIVNISVERGAKEVNA
jgi:hypothetical protein